MPQDCLVDPDAIAAIAAVPMILDVVCGSTGMGFAAVARVTEDRWIACSVRDDINFGLKPGGELKVETTICHEIRASREAVIIDNVAEDPHFAQHHTPLMYGFQSYISMPIILPDGQFFGTLCAIDPRPMRLSTPETIGMFKLFADLIAFHLDAHRRIASSTADLALERHTAELRDQFIAVLGHDLKNPLASISAGARLLGRKKLDSEANTLLELMQKSVTRMAAIIDDVLDLARGRLGQGIKLAQTGLHPVEPFIRQVVSELQSGHPTRVIEERVAPGIEVRCDRSRLGQLLSNLIANALTHGAREMPVTIVADIKDGTFELAVVNHGPAIPAAIQADLFKPYIRGPRPSGVDHAPQGLGLGLYICAEIARAHQGTLKVESSAAETRFTLRIPAA